MNGVIALVLLAFLWVSGYWSLSRSMRRTPALSSDARPRPREIRVAVHNRPKAAFSTPHDSGEVNAVRVHLGRM